MPVKSKIQFALRLLMGLMLVNSGLNKFFHYIPMPASLPEALQKDNDAMMEVIWLLPLVAFAEIAGGVLFILPRTKALGAIVLLPVLLGILLVHITVDPPGMPVALALLAVNAWVMYESRAQNIHLISRG